jgi:hypothetical protein
LNGRKITGVTVIDSKVEDQLEMTEAWVLLIEPKSNFWGGVGFANYSHQKWPFFDENNSITNICSSL